jgi:hypothetical protein
MPHAGSGPVSRHSDPTFACTTANSFCIVHCPQVQVAKDKLDAARLEELTDNEETIADLKRRHEREKLMLLEDNKKLMMDLDSVSVSFIYNLFCPRGKD